MVKPCVYLNTQVASEYKRMLEISDLKHKLDSALELYLFMYDLSQDGYSCTYFCFDHYLSSTHLKVHITVMQ